MSWPFGPMERPSIVCACQDRGGLTSLQIFSEILIVPRAARSKTIVYTEYAMETEKIGIREFRENLVGYLESGKPLAITRYGETLGFFIPAQNRSRKAEVEACAARRRSSTLRLRPGIHRG